MPPPRTRSATQASSCSQPFQKGSYGDRRRKLALCVSMLASVALRKLRRRRSHLSPQDARPLRVQHRSLVRVLQNRLQDNRQGTSVIARLLDKRQQRFIGVSTTGTHARTRRPEQRKRAAGSSDFLSAETDFWAAVDQVRPGRRAEESGLHQRPGCTTRLEGGRGGEARVQESSRGHVINATWTRPPLQMLETRTV